jgi:hypothetical protein
MTGIERIAAERHRQIAKEGYGADHDAGRHDELALAAATYALPRRFLVPASADDDTPWPWPWAPRYYKPEADRIRELVKAGALIAAAIDAIMGEAPA